MSRYTTPHTTCSAEWVRISRRRPDVIQAGVVGRSDRGQRVALGGHEIRGGDALDAGGPARPLELAEVGWLATASRVEGGLLENDGPW